MNVTPEELSRLIPEAELYSAMHLALITLGLKPGDRLEATLAHAILTDRRTLERYRGALERADTIARQYVSNDCAREIRRITGKALKED